ncbi:RNA exonuclease 4 [Glycine soja]
MKKPKPTLLSPNWVQLQEVPSLFFFFFLVFQTSCFYIYLFVFGIVQKLKPNGSKASRTFKNSDEDTPESILGKRKERPDDEPNDCQINPLAPINDDSSLTDAVAMDCEMVGVGQGNKSALGRVTLVNKWGNVIYDEFVRPIERVVDFRTKISGIRPRDLRKAKDFWAAQKKVAELINGRILVGHALSNDLKVEDARAAMLLYQRNRKEWEKNIKDQFRLKQKQRKSKQKKKQKNEDVSNANHVEI